MSPSDHSDRPKHPKPAAPAAGGGGPGVPRPVNRPLNKMPPRPNPGAAPIPLAGDEPADAAEPVRGSRAGMGSGSVAGAGAGSGAGTGERAGGRPGPAAFGPARPVAARHVDPAWSQSTKSSSGPGVDVEYEEEEEPVVVREQLKLRWWAFAAAVVGVVAAVGTKAAYDPPRGPEAASYLAGMAIGVLLIPTVVGLIVFAATRRKVTPANVVFAALCLLMGLGNGLGEVASHRNDGVNAVMKKAEQLSRDVEEEMKSAAKHGDPDPDAAKDFADRSYYIMRELGAAADEQTNTVLTAAANRVHQILQLNYEMTLRFNESRTNETLSLKRGGQQRDLKEALNEIAELDNWVRHVHKFTSESPEAIRMELRGKKVPEAAVNASIQRVMEAIQYNDYLTLRQLDMDILAGTKDLLTLLQNTYGTWTYDDIKDRFEFASTDTLRKFDAISRRIAEATAKEYELEATMRDASRRQVDRAKQMIKK